jgi:hypothetical protein
MSHNTMKSSRAVCCVEMESVSDIPETVSIMKDWCDECYVRMLQKERKREREKEEGRDSEEDYI